MVLLHVIVNAQVIKPSHVVLINMLPYATYLGESSYKIQKATSH